MKDLLREIAIEQQEVISKMLGIAIDKGIITVRQSDPVLIRDVMSDKILFRQSMVIDYLGSEKIEELEKENAYLKKINSDLHNSLKDFYEKTKVNTWLKNQNS
jgi:hypothetical protein